MKAVTFARVSSQEQENNYSLKAQNTDLLNYAKRKNLDVIKNYEITESSLKGERKQFNEMIEFCKSQKETVAILVDVVDRLQRSFDDTPLLRKLIEKGKIELHFFRQNLILNQFSRPEEFSMWHFLVLQAEQYISSFKLNVARGKDYKVKQKGLISWQAPCGYENISTQDGHKNAQRKEPEATYLKKLFETYSIGGISIHKLAQMANEYGIPTKNGNKITASSMISILDNPFYYGYMNYNGQLYRHNHPTLISKELWDKCQEQRRIQSSKKINNDRIPFLYRGIFTDFYGNRTCSCEIKKKKFAYVSCHKKNGSRLYVSENDITDQIVSILDNITLPIKAIDYFNDYIKANQSKEDHFKNIEINHIKTEISTIESKLDKLLDIRIAEKITDVKYEQKEQELLGEKENLENKLKDISSSEIDDKQVPSKLYGLFSNLGSVFQYAKDISIKQMLLKLIFKTLKLKDGNVGYILNEPFIGFEKINGL